MSVKNMRQNIKDDQHVLDTLMNSTLKNVHLVSNKTFYLTKQIMLKTKSALKELTIHYNTLLHGVILVIGAPGSGKSYLLTYWSKLFEQTKIEPIIDYCFIKDLFDEEYRISKNQLIQNLIFDILKYYPLENMSTYPLLAAWHNRLEELLKKTWTIC